MRIRTQSATSCKERRQLRHVGDADVGRLLLEARGVESVRDPDGGYAGAARGADVDRRVADQDRLVRSYRCGGEEPMQARGVGLARGYVARAPDPVETVRDAESRQDRAAHVARLVGEHG